MLSPHERHSQAIKWLISLKQEQIPRQSELRKWEQWIANEEHQAQFDEAMHVWERAGSVGPLPVPDATELATDAYDGSRPIAEWLEQRSAETYVQDEQLAGNCSDDLGTPVAKSSTARWPWRKVAVAAAASVALAWVVYAQIWSTFPTEPTLYETGIAQHKAVVLEDGSQVLLGARTALWVTFTRHGRNVVLERGEAMFDVARDQRRAFVVHAGKGTITAIGTSFSVQRERETVEVTVAEGVVRVEPRQADVEKTDSGREQRPVIATVTRDQQVRYQEGSGGAISIVRVDAAVATAWREGRLQYVDKPLADVVADVNRYSERQIVLNGPPALALRFTGVIFQDKAMQWSDQLIDIFPTLEVVDSTREQLVLRARPQGPTR